MKKRYIKNIVLYIVKLLYCLAKVGNYWFATYLDYHKKKLGIKILLYDICFFIIKNAGENFGIAGFQINNTLNIRTEIFIKKKIKIMKANFNTKIQTILEIGISKNFHGYYITIKVESIMIVQKN